MNDPPDLSAPLARTLKSEWRSSLLRHRGALSAENRSEAERLIADALTTRAVMQAWERVLVFLPWRGEPDLVTVWKAWHQRGIVLGLPMVSAHEAPLRLLEWAPGSPLVRDVMGLPAPNTSQEAEFDTWVLPCVGVDQVGHRLGAGKGFYDRTLAARQKRGLARPRVVGVCFEAARIPQDIGEPHDVALDAVLTERGWTDF
ncbi:MAG: 5-formyltetrahydrofolate cyclo-ligase [Betaproteobacteria bacterium]|nr:5-formyltetrahydrofolate cyclo-ligase [Betaproteobacteria bacterium]NBT75380.1 5-formyltetrahydrofolate cyclo-ligase [Betaproteobacteria bacterium]NBY14353.1 5-formyltetrahydrofolate cyclo-ligase [Betaproteobacteria bacterium]NCA15941.1 5-formyltetrahydrofolate cyclo-ligase [Betaproteobacteria bacterium]